MQSARGAASSSFRWERLRTNDRCASTRRGSRAPESRPCGLATAPRPPLLAPAPHFCTCDPECAARCPGGSSPVTGPGGSEPLPLLVRVVGSFPHWPVLAEHQLHVARPPPPKSRRHGVWHFQNSLGGLCSWPVAFGCALTVASHWQRGLPGRASGPCGSSLSSASNYLGDLPERTPTHTFSSY